MSFRVPNHDLPLFLNDAYPFPSSDDDDDDDDDEDLEQSPSASLSYPSTASSSVASPSSFGQASPLQPPTPADFRTHYAVNLPPSPIYHNYSNTFYPQQQMPRPRDPSPASSSGRANAIINARPARANHLPPHPLTRRPTAHPPAPQLPAARRPQAPRPPVATIDLTLSSPADIRSTRPSSKAPARKKRRVDTPTILLDDDDDNGDDDDDDSNATDDCEGRDDALPAEKPPVPDEKPKKLAGTACIICMEDEPLNLSVTPCGHMFCNKCLFGAIKATLASPQKVHGKCPVCRGKVAIKDIVVLEIKKLTKGKGRAH